MLKEFIAHIQETTSPTILREDDRAFAVTSAGKIVEIRRTIDHPDVLSLNSLDALVKLVKTEALRLTSAPLYITIPSHKTVQCFTQPSTEERYFRQTFYEVLATDVPGWDSKVQLPFEEMQIALRTRFQETPDAIYAMKLLSDITTGGKVTYNDNGIATSVVTRKGIDLQSNEAIRPIVRLKPYRTFQEVEQPESTFLIRVSERGISFTEADGGMWKLQARETVKKFLEDALKDLVTGGKVFVAL